MSNYGWHEIDDSRKDVRDAMAELERVAGQVLDKDAGELFIDAARGLIKSINGDHGTLFYPDSAEIQRLSHAMEEFAFARRMWLDAVVAGEIHIESRESR